MPNLLPGRLESSMTFKRQSSGGLRLDDRAATSVVSAEHLVSGRKNSSSRVRLASWRFMVVLRFPFHRGKSSLRAIGFYRKAHDIFRGLDARLTRTTQASTRIGD
jgi:hypothetical protein